MGAVKWLRSAILAAVVAGVCFASIVVFRLGWFFPIVAVAGSVVAAVLAVRWGASQGSRFGTIACTLGSYVVVFAFLVWALVGHESVRSFQATWQDHGVDIARQEADVFIEFVDYPGHGIGVYSTTLRDRLAADGSRSVRIDFAVTTDLGCVRGFRHIRIGDIADPAVINGKGGYARGAPPARSPWVSNFWWCR